MTSERQENQIPYSIVGGGGDTRLLRPIDCNWKETNEGSWETECGRVFEFMNDGPRENDFHFCQHCGGWLLWEAK